MIDDGDEVLELGYRACIGIPFTVDKGNQGADFLWLGEKTEDLVVTNSWESQSSNKPSWGKYFNLFQYIN